MFKISTRTCMLLTYNKNIDELFFFCDPLTSFTLCEGADVHSFVLWLNWVDVQTPIRKLCDSCLI